MWIREEQSYRRMKTGTIWLSRLLVVNEVNCDTEAEGNLIERLTVLETSTYIDFFKAVLKEWYAIIKVSKQTTGKRKIRLVILLCIPPLLTMNYLGLLIAISLNNLNLLSKSLDGGELKDGRYVGYLLLNLHVEH